MNLNVSKLAYLTFSKSLIPVQGSRCLFENLQYVSAITTTSIRTKTSKKAQPEAPTNITALTGIQQEGKGKIYDKKPFTFKCIKGKTYLWCACGWSKSQPFCDSTHKNHHYRIKMIPLRFIAPETKEYVFCNCKQTNNRPFCDGTHKSDEIQAAVKS